MYNFPIGVFVGDIKDNFDTSLKMCEELKVSGIQFTISDSMAKGIPEKRREIEERGLCVSALCDNFDFTVREQNAGRIEQLKRTFEIAKEYGTDIVTGHLGHVPENPNDEKYKYMQQACYEISLFTGSIGSFFAIEAGPDRSEILKPFLDGIDTKGIAVNFDCGNLIMYVNENPANAVRRLGKYIVHTHAKDGRRVIRTKQELKENPNCALGREYPLGDGWVNFPEYMCALDEIGYRGFMAIEREQGDRIKEDIADAVGFLRSIIENC